MWRRRAASVIGLGLLGSAAGLARADRPRPLRVLFVGNSYTRFNGLTHMVRRISESIPGGRAVRPSESTRPGWSLRRHWERARARRRIADGGYDAVVLQGRSLGPIETPDELRDYANRFAAHAQAHGSRVVLFETWARREDHLLYRHSTVRDPGEMLARIEAVYGALGRELGAPVAPVGRLWAEARRALPETSLHRDDGTHPSVAGTYLAALVLYATLTGADPRACDYRPHPLGRRQATGIRELCGPRVPVDASGQPDDGSCPVELR